MAVYWRIEHVWYVVVEFPCRQLSSMRVHVFEMMMRLLYGLARRLDLNMYCLVCGGSWEMYLNCYETDMDSAACHNVD